MPTIHQTATITSKGQITLPKSIRQALGVDVGGKVSFDFTGDHVIVSRFETVQHEDPSVQRFLALIEKDISAGKNVGHIPENLKMKMLEEAEDPVNIDEIIKGNVSL
jgi:antitoxin PrlF